VRLNVRPNPGCHSRTRTGRMSCQRPVSRYVDTKPCCWAALCIAVIYTCGATICAFDPLIGSAAQPTS
jgi:hypothetical protein